MHDSRFKTYAVPQVNGALPSPTPATIAIAGTVPARVVVRNVSAGATPIFISADTVSVSDFPPTADSYQLPAGQSDVFVLAPKMRLFAAAGGVGGVVCVSSSDALPIDLEQC